MRDHEQKIISGRVAEKRPLNVCVSKYCMPGRRAPRASSSRAARRSGEDDRRDEVLDTDHLVVGVDAE